MILFVFVGRGSAEKGFDVGRVEAKRFSAVGDRMVMIQLSPVCLPPLLVGSCIRGTESDCFVAVGDGRIKFRGVLTQEAILSTGNSAKEKEIRATPAVRLCEAG